MSYPVDNRRGVDRHLPKQQRLPKPPTATWVYVWIIIVVLAASARLWH